MKSSAISRALCFGCRASGCLAAPVVLVGVDEVLAEDLEAAQVFCRILLSCEDARHAEVDRFCSLRASGAVGA